MEEAIWGSGRQQPTVSLAVTQLIISHSKSCLLPFQEAHGDDRGILQESKTKTRGTQQGSLLLQWIGEKPISKVLCDSTTRATPM